MQATALGRPAARPGTSRRPPRATVSRDAGGSAHLGAAVRVEGLRGGMRCRAASGPGKDVVGPSGAFSQQQEELSEARQKLFDDIAPVYDQLNDLLSVGQHRVWKRTAIKWTGAKPGDRCIDICCGSGDIALRLADTVGPGGSVVGLDFAAEQLEVAAGKQSLLPALAKYSCPIEWVQGDAMDLPYGEGEFDAATMGYGLRNVADIPLALQELHRVLKPGGTVAVLDFNNADDELTRGLQGFFLDNLVVPAASAFGLGPEYEYLRPSIEAFPRGAEQVRLAKEAGFKKAVHYKLMGGLMGCLVATKA